MRTAAYPAIRQPARLNRRRFREGVPLGTVLLSHRCYVRQLEKSGLIGGPSCAL
jgi:hypothetical protein